MVKETVVQPFGKKFPDVQEIIEEKVREDEVYRYDSGRMMSFDDLVHHAIALGTTGSGKTASLIYPVIWRMMALGAGGIIIDIKGNMRAAVRKMGNEHNLTDKVIEIGNSRDAESYNILKGKNRQQIRALFERLALDNFNSNTNNLDFHIKGVEIAADYAQLCLFISEKYPEFVLDCVLVYEMLISPDDASELYQFAKDHVFDMENAEHRQFTRKVDNDVFHGLHVVDKKKADRDFLLKRAEQLAWSLESIRNGMRNFLETPGITENFCARDGEELSLVEPFLQGKIILVRFDLGTGKIGARLSRMILSLFYETMLTYGLFLQKSRKTFVCIDEFQEVADLSDDRFSDAQAIALAREFNCAFIIATQSVSALIQRSAAENVWAFIANCNQKIMFYSDDPLTQTVADSYDRDVRLSGLNSGEAFAVTYDREKRKHFYGVESVQMAYESVRPVLENVKTPLDIRTKEDAKQECRLLKALEWAQDIRKAIIAEEAESNAADPVNITASSGKTGSMLNFLESLRPDENHSEDDDSDDDFADDEFDVDDDDDNYEDEEQVAMYPELDEYAKSLVDEFPDMFDPHEDDFCISVPKGWRGYLENALSAFEKTGMSISIGDIHVTHGYLIAFSSSSADRRQSEAIRMLNMILEKASRLCAICGQPLEISPETLRYAYENEGHYMPLCKECQELLGLTIPDHEPEAPQMR